MGADPNRPDIFVQIDWMRDATRSQMLSKVALQQVADAFNAHGITLHIDEGPNSVNFPASLSRGHAIAFQDTLGTGVGASYNWTAFQTVKDANFTPSGRTPIFHYVIAANTIPSCSSGMSRSTDASGGSDLIVSLGTTAVCPGFTNSNTQQAGSFMHELGHNLGLQHGGGDGTNYKPNYLSVMNYAFQLDGVIKAGNPATIDYSGFGPTNVPTLNESGQLNEAAGLGPGATDPSGQHYGTRHWCVTQGVFVSVTDATQNVDWDCSVANNGPDSEPAVTADVNGDGNTTDTLAPFNDWVNLKFKGGAIGLAGVTPNLPITTPIETSTPATQVLIQPVPTAGFATGSGSILHNGVPADFSFNPKYIRQGQIQGALTYTEHRSTGDVVLKSTNLLVLSISTNSPSSATAIITGRATVNGVGAYTFRATVTDNGEPGLNDTFGMSVIDQKNNLLPDLSFSPLKLTAGNIQAHLD
jgi:hypothetical protein